MRSVTSPKANSALGQKKYPAIEDRTNLRVHSEHEQFGIESGTCTDTEVPASGLCFYVLLKVSDLRWKRLGLRLRGSGLCFWRRLQYGHRARKSVPSSSPRVEVTRTRVPIVIVCGFVV